MTSLMVPLTPQLPLSATRCRRACRQVELGIPSTTYRCWPSSWRRARSSGMNDNELPTPPVRTVPLPGLADPPRRAGSLAAADVNGLLSVATGREPGRIRHGSLSGTRLADRVAVRAVRRLHDDADRQEQQTDRDDDVRLRALASVAIVRPVVLLPSVRVRRCRRRNGRQQCRRHDQWNRRGSRVCSHPRRSRSARWAPARVRSPDGAWPCARPGRWWGRGRGPPMAVSDGHGKSGRAVLAASERGRTGDGQHAALRWPSPRQPTCHDPCTGSAHQP